MQKRGKLRGEKKIKLWKNRSKVANGNLYLQVSTMRRTLMSQIGLQLTLNKSYNVCTCMSWKITKSRFSPSWTTSTFPSGVSNATVRTSMQVKKHPNTLTIATSKPTIKNSLEKLKINRDWFSASSQVLTIHVQELSLPVAVFWPMKNGSLRVINLAWLMLQWKLSTIIEKTYLSSSKKHSQKPMWQA